MSDLGAPHAGERLPFGAICRVVGCVHPRFGQRVLVFDRDEEDAPLAVGYPAVDSASFAVPETALALEQEDPAAARVLRRRRRESLALAERPRDAREAPPIRTAMVLCAGLGTRLKPLTDRVPKPAVPFLGAPLVRYSLALLEAAGVERVVVNTHHLPDLMAGVARDEARALGLDLAISHEPVVQGTAGGLRDARLLLGEGPWLLVNGDAFLSLDLAPLVAAHASRGDAATLAVTPLPPDEPYGAVEASPDGRVRRIGAPSGGRDLLPWHFVGVHVLSEETLAYIAPAGPQDINRDTYPAMIAAGRPVRVCPVTLGAWADLGTARRYLDACEELMTGLCDLTPLGPAAPLSADRCEALRRAGVAGRVVIDPTARVAPDARVERAWVGPGAEVGPRAVVRRAAVLDGTRIDAGERVEEMLAAGDLRVDARKADRDGTSSSRRGHPPQ